MSRLCKILLTLTCLTGFMIPALANEPILAVDVINNSSVCQNKDITSSTPVVCGNNQSNTSNLNGPILGPNVIVTKVVSIMAIIIGVAAVIMIIVGGMRFVFGGG